MKYVKKLLSSISCKSMLSSYLCFGIGFGISLVNSSIFGGKSFAGLVSTCTLKKVMVTFKNLLNNAQT